MATNKNVRFLRTVNIGKAEKKYCRFKKYNIKFVDYKNPDFLMSFINEQGKLFHDELLVIARSISVKLLKR